MTESVFTRCMRFVQWHLAWQGAAKCPSLNLTGHVGRLEAVAAARDRRGAHAGDARLEALQRRARPPRPQLERSQGVVEVRDVLPRRRRAAPAAVPQARLQ